MPTKPAAQLVKAPTKTITQDALYRAFLVWEAEHRAGLTESAEVTASKPIEQVAAEAAENFWTRLREN